MHPLNAENDSPVKRRSIALALTKITAVFLSLAAAVPNSAQDEEPKASAA